MRITREMSGTEAVAVRQTRDTAAPEPNDSRAANAEDGGWPSRKTTAVDPDDTDAEDAATEPNDSGRAADDGRCGRRGAVGVEDGGRVADAEDGGRAMDDGGRASGTKDGGRAADDGGRASGAEIRRLRGGRRRPCGG